MTRPYILGQPRLWSDVLPGARTLIVLNRARLLAERQLDTLAQTNELLANLERIEQEREARAQAARRARRRVRP